MRRAATAVRTLVLASVLGLAPNACSQRSDISVTPTELPRLKPGLWRTITHTGVGPPDTLVQCIGQDHSLALSMGEAQARCPTLSMTRAGKTYRVTARCRHEGGETIVRALFSGDFRNTMRAEMRITLLAPDRPSREMKLVSEGRYEGRCPPGQPLGLVDDGG